MTKSAPFTHKNFKEKAFGSIRGEYGTVKFDEISREHENAIIDKYLTNFRSDEFHKKPK